MRRCVVIGGGAAGMMAAYSAKVSGGFDEVLLLEKNEKLGKKVYITGKGRCNVTNACSNEEFFNNVVSNPKFLYSAYYGFDNNALMRLIEDNGCPLKTERGNRVFPVSDHSSDIIKAMSDVLKKAGVKVRLNTEVREILTGPIRDASIKESPVLREDGMISDKDNPADGKRVTGIVLKTGEKKDCDRVVIATGGLSYPSTGSTGDGHRMLKRLGHTVTDCRPALVPLEVKEVDECMLMQGLALKNVSLRLSRASKKKSIYDGFGEMLFTHFGVSGPLILSASSHYGQSVKGTVSEAEDIILHIDLKPALSHEQLDLRMLRDFDAAKNKSIHNVMGGLLPGSMIPVILKRCNISPDKKINEITKQERDALTDTIKDYSLHVTGTRDYNEAIITQGGVNVKEINPSTMESKLIKGLYIAGELLDVDALTGGFNLQIAWSTGYLAGEII